MLSQVYLSLQTARPPLHQKMKTLQIQESFSAGFLTPSAGIGP
jgi:hypothetical protein